MYNRIVRKMIMKYSPMRTSPFAKTIKYIVRKYYFSILFFIICEYARTKKQALKSSLKACV
jgi:hypothetical protein